jgi:hypothetical protein
MSPKKRRLREVLATYRSGWGRDMPALVSFSKRQAQRPQV